MLAFVVDEYSNKYAGYALGLAPTTVADHIRSALAKLALGSRREVIALLGAGGEQASGAPWRDRHRANTLSRIANLGEPATRECAEKKIADHEDDSTLRRRTSSDRVAKARPGSGMRCGSSALKLGLLGAHAMPTSSTRPLAVAARSVPPRTGAAFLRSPSPRSWRGGRSAPWATCSGCATSG